jgi:PAS domain S-box-containing protein
MQQDSPLPQDRNLSPTGSTEVLDAFMESALDGYLRVAADGRVLQANPAYCRMSGYALEELRGLAIADLDATATSPLVAGRHQEVLRYGSERFHSRHVTRHGAVVDVEVQVLPLPGLDQFAGLVRDITAQEHLEQALRSSEARLREAQSVGGVGSLELDLRTNLLELSEETLRIIGRPGPNTILTGKEFDEAMFPGDLAAIQAGLAAAIRGEQPLDLQHRILTPDGQIKWVHARAELIRGPGGESLALLGTLQDITERHLAEERFEKVFRCSPQAIAISRRSDDRLVDVNEAWCNLFGWTREEALGRTTLELELWGRERPELTRELLRTGRIRPRTVDLRSRAGQSLAVLLSARTVEMDGEVCLLVTSQDDAERRRLELARPRT